MACGSGRNKVDKAVEACWQARQTGKEATIDFARAFDFEWDSLRFYSVGCSLEDIDHDLGFPLTEYTDLADRMVFLNHGKPAYVAGGMTPRGHAAQPSTVLAASIRPTGSMPGSISGVKATCTFCTHNESELSLP